jgi:hypothetical protein
MEYDYHRAEEKRSELKDVAASILREFNSKRSETLAGKIIDHFVRITPPEQAENTLNLLQCGIASACGVAKASSQEIFF